MEDLEYDMDIGATIDEDPAPRAADPMDDAFDDVSAAGDILDDNEEDDDLAEVPAQSLNEVIDELHEDDEQEEVPAIQPPLSEQLKQPAGKVLSAIALQGISTHAKKRPIAGLDEAWLRATWTRITGLLNDQPDADEVEDWRSDVRLLECEADLRDVDLFLPIAAPEAVTKDLPKRIADAQLCEIVQVPVDEIAPDPAQARDEGADDELAELIRANGFYQSKPIEVRAHPQFGKELTGGWGSAARYMIVDGERRYRGAVKAGHTHVPAMIVELEDEGARLLRQVNSNQGKPLKPLEEARTYQRIMAAKSWSIQQLADHLGKSKSTVSDRVAMAEAPPTFQPLFEDGTLTAAAAPIIRRLEGVPSDIVQKILANAQNSYAWRQHVDAGRTVPLKNVETLLVPDTWNFPVVEGGGKDFAGATFEFKGSRYAIQRADYINHVNSKHATTPEAGKQQRENDQYEEKRRADDKKRRDAVTRKRETRFSQFHAISRKLPARIDGPGALVLIQAFARMNGYAFATCKALGITPEKKTAAGANFPKLLLAHAEKQNAEGRIRLLFQLAMSPDLTVSEWSNSDADHLKEAAKLVRLDLAKVKAEAAVKKPAAKKTAKPSHKAKVRQLNAAFMKPYPLTEQLQAVVGKGPLMRTEVTTKLWQYIKRNGLQDQKERRMINADEKLKPIFKGKKQVSMFEMTKLINKHLVGFKA